MTKRTGRNHLGSFKTKMPLRGDKTLTGIAQQYELHPNQVTEWKRQLLEWAAEVFEGSAAAKLRRSSGVGSFGAMIILRVRLASMEMSK